MRKIITIPLLVFTLPALAAPLDALLQKRTSGQALNGEANLSIDLMNNTLEKLYSANGFDDTSSDYTGGHIFTGLALTSRLWIDATYWQRDMNLTKNTKSVDASINGWQLAAQYTLIDGADSGPSLSLRAGTWANSTDKVANQFNGNALLKGSSGTAKLWIDHPHDKQVQLDIIGSLPITKQITVNTFASIGNSKIDFDNAGGNATFNGCYYTLQFDPAQYSGILAKPCSEDIVATRFTSPYSAKDINIHKELNYDSRFYQAGLTTQWQSKDWHLSTGYVYFTIDRNMIDATIKKRNKKTYTNNHTILMDIRYRILQGLFITATAQYMHNQFISEIPLTYNSLSAPHFDKHYGLVSIGITTLF